MKKILNQSGYFFAFELLLGIALVSIFLLGSSAVITQFDSFKKSSRTESNVEFIRENILALVLDQRAWDETKRRNAAMSCIQQYPSTCSSDTEAVINLYNAEGQKLVNSTNPTVGFTYEGEFCNAFDASQGNWRCPIRVVLSWKVRCADSTECQFPEELLSGEFYHSSDDKDHQLSIPIKRLNFSDLSRNTLDEKESPVVVCANRGLIFLGYDQTIENGDGEEATTDDFGCVSHLALKGPRGFRGRKGNRGPVGLRGPRGPAWDAPGPSPTPIPTPPPDEPPNDPPAACDSYPKICELYLTYLDRYPEEQGAHYWVSIFQKSSDWDYVEANFVDLINTGEAGAVSEVQVLIIEMDDGTLLTNHELYNQIASEYGSNLTYESCQSSGTDCFSGSTQILEAYQRAVDETCASNSCHKNSVSISGFLDDPLGL